MPRPIRPQTGVTAPEGWDREFYDYVMSLRLSGDMKYILVKQNSNGTSVTLNLQALLDSISIPTSGGGKGGDASYKGYFAVVDDSDLSGETPIYRVKVIDGALGDPEEAETAGDAQINDVIYNDIEAVEIELAAGWNYIYLIAEFEETPTIESFSTKQEYADGYSKTLIARVNYVDGAIKIVQEHFGMIYASIYGDCEE